VLEVLLRLLHPFIPFITEELWQKVAPIINKAGKTIMLQPYPLTNDVPAETGTVEEINWVKSFILAVRRIRAERDIAPGKTLHVKVKDGNYREKTWLRDNMQHLQSLARIESITEIKAAPDDAVMALAGDMTLLVPLADIIDLNTEKNRLQKEHDKLNKVLEMCRDKLSNESFVSRAPAEVILKERVKLDETAAAINILRQEIARIEKLMSSN
jgi:valyl-tRNA synthetase